MTKMNATEGAVALNQQVARIGGQLWTFRADGNRVQSAFDIEYDGSWRSLRSWRTALEGLRRLRPVGDPERADNVIGDVLSGGWEKVPPEALLNDYIGG